MQGNELYKVTNTREQLMISDSGKPLAGIRVEFMVGDQGPFVEMFPKERLTASDVEARLGAFARTIKQLHGVY
jgi:hypothetical protein